MGKKLLIRITEQQLADLISKNILGPYTDFIGKSKDYVKDLFSGINIIDDTPTTNDNNKSQNPTGGKFPTLDLNKTEDYNVYKQIADKFISGRPNNLLGIRGYMLADSAKSAQNKYGNYVPVELALSQLAVEGGFSNNPNSRPIRTKNPFNVGNFHNGKNTPHSSVESGIQSYYDLMAKNYLGKNKTASDLLNNFVNNSGNRYAMENNYEESLSKIVNQVNNISKPLYTTLDKTKDSSGYA